MKLIRLISVGVLLLTAASSLLSAPIIQVDKTEHDAGEVMPMQSVRAVFRVKNIGDEDLEIIRMDSACGCSETKIENKKIAPGKFSNVEIVFNPGSLAGSTNKAFAIVSNDPVNPNIKLLCKAKVLELARMNPSMLNFGSIKPGTTLEQTVILTPSKADGFSIKEIKSTGNRVIAKVESPEKERNDYKLKLTIKAGDIPGRLLERLTLITGLEGNPSISLLVYGNVEH